LSAVYGVRFIRESLLAVADGKWRQ